MKEPKNSNCAKDPSKLTRLMKQKQLNEIAQAAELMKARAGASSLSTGPNTVNSSGNSDFGLASGSQASSKPTGGTENKRKMPSKEIAQADEVMKMKARAGASSAPTGPNTVNLSCNTGLVSGSQGSLKPTGGMGNKKKMQLKEIEQIGELMNARAGASNLSTGPNTVNSSCSHCHFNCNAGLASGSQGSSKTTGGMGNKRKMQLKEIAQDDELLMKAKAAEASSASTRKNTVNSSCNTGLVSGSQGYSKPTGASGVGNKRKMPSKEIAQAEEPTNTRDEASSASTRPNTVNSSCNTGLTSGSQGSLKPTGGMGNKRKMTVDDEDEWERNDEVYKRRVCQFWCSRSPKEFRRMQKEITELKTLDDEYQITKRLPYSFTLFLTAMNIQ